MSEKKTYRADIISVNPFGKGVMCNVTYQVGGASAKATAFFKDFEGKEGVELEVEIWEEEYNGAKQVRIAPKQAPKSGGGFRGGGGKADPDRTAVAKEANEIRREDGKRIKECFDEKQSAIMAQVAVKEAGETYRSLNLPDWDANKFDGMAVDIMDTLNGLVKRDKDGTNVQ